MAKTVLTVKGMTCGHCSSAVKKAVEALPGVTSAVVDLAAKTATIEHDLDKAPIDKIKAAITDQGFKVAG